MLTLLAAALFAGADPKPTLRLTEPKPGAPQAVEASGLSAALAGRLKGSAGWTADEWAAVLKVVLADGTEAEVAARPPLLGAYSFRDGVLRFEPRFPFAPGVRYRATLADAEPVTKEFAIPKPRAEPGVVAAVYPSGDKLPENTLRFYLQFSKPMARGDAYRFVKLVNETDRKDVDLPFLELDEELWSPDRTRFTLLIDPGRIKREVKPREDLGPALEAGKSFTLVVARDWPDADGTKLKAEFRKAFTVGPPDRAPVDPAKWRIDPPTGGGPLAVTLENPLDHALLHRMVWVTGPDGKKLDTAATVADRERRVTFAAPKGGWPAGAYKLVIDTRLEDPCGNRVGEPFEVDVFRRVERSIEVETVSRAFEVK